jgi:hypothetical protein
LKVSFSVVRFRDTETSEFLANVVHKSSQVNMLILIHLIAFYKCSWDLLEVVFSMARLVSLSTHCNNSSGFAPNTFRVLMARVSLKSGVAYLFVTIEFHG